MSVNMCRNRREKNYLYRLDYDGFSSDCTDRCMHRDLTTVSRFTCFNAEYKPILLPSVLFLINW